MPSTTKADARTRRAAFLLTCGLQLALVSATGLAFVTRETSPVSAIAFAAVALAILLHEIVDARSS